MADRCDEGFAPGLCWKPSCKHYQGKSSRSRRYPANPKLLLKCGRCRRRLPPKQLVKLEAGAYQCLNCRQCDADGCSNDRVSGLDYCQEHVDQFSAPKPCVHCGEPIECDNPRLLVRHMQRTSHERCSRAKCKDRMFRRNSRELHSKWDREQEATHG